jgi:hypothetical protein
MDCKTRSGRIVREETNRKVRLTSLQLYPMSLSEGPLLKCIVTLLGFDRYYKTFFRPEAGHGNALVNPLHRRLHYRCCACCTGLRFVISDLKSSPINLYKGR